MSRRFRERPIDPNRPMAIYLEPAAFFGNQSGRQLPTIKTGVDAEEEKELDLQKLLASSAPGAAAAAAIPTPRVEAYAHYAPRLDWKGHPKHSEEVVLAAASAARAEQARDGGHKARASVSAAPSRARGRRGSRASLAVRRQAKDPYVAHHAPSYSEGMAAISYDADREDGLWLAQAGLPPAVTLDVVEAVLDRLEKAAWCATPPEPEAVPFDRAAEHLDSGGALTQGLPVEARRAIYEYWRARREAQKPWALNYEFHEVPEFDEKDLRIPFRPRVRAETGRLRAIYENNAAALDRMRVLAANRHRELLLLQSLKVRESLKMRVLEREQAVFEWDVAHPDECRARLEVEERQRLEAEAVSALKRRRRSSTSSLGVGASRGENVAPAARARPARTDARSKSALERLRLLNTETMAETTRTIEKIMSEEQSEDTFKAVGAGFVGLDEVPTQTKLVFLVNASPAAAGANIVALPGRLRRSRGRRVAFEPEVESDSLHVPKRRLIQPAMDAIYYYGTNML